MNEELATEFGVMRDFVKRLATSPVQASTHQDLENFVCAIQKEAGKIIGHNPKNDTWLAKCAQWHEMQAASLRATRTLLSATKVVPTVFMPDITLLDNDIVMHEVFAKACKEAQ